jgi:hypothetical protein
METTNISSLTGVRYGDYLRVYTLFALLVALLQEFSHQTAYSLHLERDALRVKGNAMPGRGLCATDVLPSPVCGAVALIRVSENCSLQMMGCF